MSALIETELAVTCNALGGLHGGKYVMEPQCYESVRDIIRYLRRDDAYHQVRVHLGKSKILQTDFIHIAKASSGELFDLVIRLLVSLTNPVILLYKEEHPCEKQGRNIYMNLIAFTQDYKVAFCDVDFWKVIFEKLAASLEVDWAERSEESSLQIERMLVLLRNVLQVPADNDLERRPDKDITVHDKLLWALRESKILELLLYISSNKDEQQYYLHLLEIFSLILREQRPEVLAKCEIRRSVAEKEQDSRELAGLREKEKLCGRQFKNTRNFSPTYVVKNVKTFANKDLIYHKSLDKLNELKLSQDKRRQKTPKNKFPVDSERLERSSAFSVRMFLKEFCVEFLACGFNNLMGYVKDKLVAGKGLPNDESYYFWALKFFLEFACYANVEVKLVSECLRVETFHFAQTQIEKCYDNITMDKKKIATWVRRLHLVLKAYHALLQSLQWMDSSKEPRIRESSKVLKSNLFYVVEYRELMLDCLLRYDSGKYPISFLRDLIETNHFNLKLLENFCKSSKIVVQRKKRVVKRSKKGSAPVKELPRIETPDEKWYSIKEDAFEVISKNESIPEIPPFDAASSVPIDDQKGEAMKKIQGFLWNRSVNNAIGLLRSSRQVWPEDDIFGSASISVEEEVMALQEICIADLGVAVKDSSNVTVGEDVDAEDSDEDGDEEPNMEIIEQNFELQDYIKKLVNKKVIEGCSILLANYKKNSITTNHCVVKLLHRIAWDCRSPSMLYQASLFMTLLRIIREKDPVYRELQGFSKHLMKKFRENAKTNPMIFMELLFWKDVKTAHDIENGYGTSDEKDNRRTWSEEEEDEVRRLWVEFDEKMIDADKIDWIVGNLINQSRSRMSVLKKLKELMLIMPGEKVSKRRRGGKEWTEQEITELTLLFNQFKSSMDVVTMIKERMALARSKKSIKDKIVELGLVANLSELRKKKVKKGKSVVDNAGDPIASSSSESESENDVENINPRPLKKSFSVRDAVEALKMVQDNKDGLDWLQRCLEECLEEEEGCDGYPLLAITEAESQVLADMNFQNVLKELGLTEPNGEQIFWEVKAMSKLEMHDRIELVKGALAGEWPDVTADEKSIQHQDSEDSDLDDGFERLKTMMVGSGGKSVDKTSQGRSRGRNRRNASELEDVRSASSSPMSGILDVVSKVSKDRSRSPSLSSEPRRAASVGSDVGEEKSKHLNSRIDSESEHDSPSKRDGTFSNKLLGRRQVIVDENSSTDDDERPNIVRKSRKPSCLASDSEGEASPAPEPWKYKRRRCIGSDSEVEENPSDDDRKSVRLEVRKKTRLLDSDSEVEGHGSMDEGDEKLSR